MTAAGESAGLGTASTSCPGGRAAAIGRVGELLGRSARAAGSTVVVEGAPGGGVSSALVEAAVRYGRGFDRVLTARATGGAEYEALLGAFGGTDAVGALRAAVTPESAQDPCRVGVLARELAEWIGPKRLLLVLDDLHRADPASVAVLDALLRRDDSPLTLLGGGRTGRTPAPLRAVAGVGNIVRLPRWDEIETRTLLPGLSEVRARTLVAACDGRPGRMATLRALPSSELRRLHRIPVEMLAEHLEAAGDPVPQDTAETVDVAGAAAVLSLDVEVEAVAAISGRPVPRVLAALAVLVAEGVLGDVAGRLRFAHPVERARSYRGVTAPRRCDLHRRAAEYVATAPGASVLDAAEHLVVCAAAGDSAAIGTLLAAAERRLRHDPDTSAHWASGALRLCREHDEAPARQAHHVLAQAFAATGRHARALEHATRLLGDDHSAATLVAARSERALGRAGVALSLARAELGHDGPLRAELVNEALSAAVVLGDHEVVGDLRLPAARPQDGDAQLAARQLLELGRRTLTPTPGVRLPDLVPLARDVAAAVDALPGSGLGEIVPYLPVLVWSELRLGLADLAAMHAERGLHAAGGRTDAVARLQLAAGAVADHLGAPDESIARHEEAAELAADLGLAGLARAARACALPARIAVHGTAALVGVTAPPVPVRPTVADRICALATARAYLLAARYDEAHDALLPLFRAAGAETAEAAVPEALAAMLAVARRDLAAAELHLRRARSAATLGTTSDLAETDLADSLVLGLRGDGPGAVAAARRALAGFEQLAAHVDAGRARLQLADALRGAGALHEAQHEAGLAKRVLQVRGAHHLVTVAITAQKRVAASAARGLRPGAFGLSEREAEIAELVRQGLTNKVIAGQLFLSVRTVDSHVARVLAKVGVSSRIELVGLFADEGVRVTAS